MLLERFGLANLPEPYLFLFDIVLLVLRVWTQLSRIAQFGTERFGSQLLSFDALAFGSGYVHVALCVV